MAQISSDQVAKVALLARLSNNTMTAEELDNYSNQLSTILEHIEEIQDIDTGEITATDGWRTCTIEDLRDDVPNQDPDLYHRQRLNIIQGFPQSQGDLLMVPGIFDDN